MAELHSFDLDTTPMYRFFIIAAKRVVEQVILGLTKQIDRTDYDTKRMKWQALLNQYTTSKTKAIADKATALLHLYKQQIAFVDEVLAHKRVDFYMQWELGLDILLDDSILSVFKEASEHAQKFVLEREQALCGLKVAFEREHALNDAQMQLANFALRLEPDLVQRAAADNTRDVLVQQITTAARAQQACGASSFSFAPFAVEKLCNDKTSDLLCAFGTHIGELEAMASLQAVISVALRQVQEKQQQILVLLSANQLDAKQRHSFLVPLQAEMERLRSLVTEVTSKSNQERDSFLRSHVQFFQTLISHLFIAKRRLLSIPSSLVSKYSNRIDREVQMFALIRSELEWETTIPITLRNNCTNEHLARLSQLEADTVAGLLQSATIYLDFKTCDAARALQLRTNYQTKAMEIKAKAARRQMELREACEQLQPSSIPFQICILDQVKWLRLEIMAELLVESIGGLRATDFLSQLESEVENRETRNSFALLVEFRGVLRSVYLLRTQTNLHAVRLESLIPQTNGTMFGDLNLDLFAAAVHIRHTYEVFLRDPVARRKQEFLTKMSNAQTKLESFSRSIEAMPGPFTIQDGINKNNLLQVTAMFLATLNATLEVLRSKQTNTLYDLIDALEQDEEEEILYRTAIDSFGKQRSDLDRIEEEPTTSGTTKAASVRTQTKVSKQLQVTLADVYCIEQFAFDKNGLENETIRDLRAQCKALQCARLDQKDACGNLWNQYQALVVAQSVSSSGLSYAFPPAFVDELSKRTIVLDELMEQAKKEILVLHTAQKPMEERVFTVEEVRNVEIALERLAKFLSDFDRLELEYATLLHSWKQDLKEPSSTEPPLVCPFPASTAHLSKQQSAYEGMCMASCKQGEDVNCVMNLEKQYETMSIAYQKRLFSDAALQTAQDQELAKVFADVLAKQMQVSEKWTELWSAEDYPTAEQLLKDFTQSVQELKEARKFQTTIGEKWDAKALAKTAFLIPMTLESREEICADYASDPDVFQFCHTTIPESCVANPSASCKELDDLRIRFVSKKEPMEEAQRAKDVLMQKRQALETLRTSITKQQAAIEAQDVATVSPDVAIETRNQLSLDWDALEDMYEARLVARSELDEVMDRIKEQNLLFTQLKEAKSLREATPRTWPFMHVKESKEEPSSCEDLPEIYRAQCRQQVCTLEGTDKVCWNWKVVYYFYQERFTDETKSKMQAIQTRLQALQDELISKERAFQAATTLQSRNAILLEMRSASRLLDQEYGALYDQYVELANHTIPIKVAIAKAIRLLEEHFGNFEALKRAQKRLACEEKEGSLSLTRVFRCSDKTTTLLEPADAPAGNQALLDKIAQVLTELQSTNKKMQELQTKVNSVLEATTGAATLSAKEFQEQRVIPLKGTLESLDKDAEQYDSLAQRVHRLLMELDDLQNQFHADRLQKQANEIAEKERLRKEAEEALRKAEEERKRLEEEARKEAERLELERRRLEEEARKEAERLELERRRIEEEVRKEAERLELERKRLEEEARKEAERLELERKRLEEEARKEAERLELERKRLEEAAREKQRQEALAEAERRLEAEELAFAQASILPSEKIAERIQTQGCGFLGKYKRDGNAASGWSLINRALIQLCEQKEPMCLQVVEHQDAFSQLQSKPNDTIVEAYVHLVDAQITWLKIRENVRSATRRSSSSFSSSLDLPPSIIREAIVQLSPHVSYFGQDEHVPNQVFVLFGPKFIANASHFVESDLLRLYYLLESWRKQRLVLFMQAHANELFPASRVSQTQLQIFTSKFYASSCNTTLLPNLEAEWMVFITNQDSQCETRSSVSPSMVRCAIDTAHLTSTNIAQALQVMVDFFFRGLQEKVLAPLGKRIAVNKQAVASEIEQFRKKADALLQMVQLLGMFVDVSSQTQVLGRSRTKEQKGGGGGVAITTGGLLGQSLTEPQAMQIIQEKVIQIEILHHLTLLLPLLTSAGSKKKAAQLCDEDIVQRLTALVKRCKGDNISSCAELAFEEDLISTGDYIFGPKKHDPAQKQKEDQCIRSLAPKVLA